MEDISVFTDKQQKPDENQLKLALGPSYLMWKQIHDMALEKYPDGAMEWNYPGKKYGWSYRIKDKKRAILYFLPRDHYFEIAFVFGEKALKTILDSDINDKIKTDLKNARKYAEGRGVRIEVSKDSIADIGKLIDIKLRH